MLNAAGREEKLGTDSTHLGPLTVLEHSLNPVRSDHLGVVVEEEKILSTGRRDCEIVHARKVKEARVSQHSEGLGFEICDRCRIPAFVIHDQDLVVRIGRLLPDTLDTRSHIVQSILCQDDYAHAGISENPSPNAVLTRIDHEDFRIDAAAPHGIFQGGLTILSGARFIRHVQGDRVRRLPPVVENVWDMPNPIRPFGHSEEKVVVLCPIVSFAEAAHPLDHAASDHGEMAEVVVR